MPNGHGSPLWSKQDRCRECRSRSDPGLTSRLPYAARVLRFSGLTVDNLSLVVTGVLGSFGVRGGLDLDGPCTCWSLRSTVHVSGDAAAGRR